MTPGPSRQSRFQKGPSSSPARVQQRETRSSDARDIAASTQEARASPPECPIPTEAIDAGGRYAGCGATIGEKGRMLPREMASDRGVADLIIPRQQKRVLREFIAVGYV